MEHAKHYQDGAGVNRMIELTFSQFYDSNYHWYKKIRNDLAHPRVVPRWQFRKSRFHVWDIKFEIQRELVG